MPLTFSLVGAIPDGMQIDAASGKMQWDVPETETLGYHRLTIAVYDGSASATAGVVLTVVDAPPPPPDLPPPFFEANKDFRAELISADTVNAFSLHIGSYLGKGRFAITLVYHSTGSLAANRTSLLQASVVGAVYEGELTYTAASESVVVIAPNAPILRRLDWRRAVNNIPETIKFTGKITENAIIVNDSSWVAYDKAAAMAEATASFVVGRRLKFEELGDKYYFGRIALNVVTRNEFEGVISYDGTGNRLTGVIKNSPSWTTHRIIGMFNEDGTVGIVFREKLTTAPGATASVLDGNSEVLKPNGAFLTGIRFQIAP